MAFKVNICVNKLQLLLIAAFTLNNVSGISSNDYKSNEEMVTMPDLDFFDNENFNDYADITQQQQQQQQQSSLLLQSSKNLRDYSTNLQPTTETTETFLIYQQQMEQQQQPQQQNILNSENVISTIIPDTSSNFIQKFNANSNEDNETNFYGNNKNDELNQTQNYDSEENTMYYSGLEENSSELFEPMTTNMAIVTTTTTPTPRIKQGKQIQIAKLLPHETLRKFIEDAYIRTPLAALVDTNPNTLDKAKLLWKDALRANAALDVVLLAFNETGIIVRYSFKNTRTLLAGLNSIKKSEKPLSGQTFGGIIRATELIPYDSAVFLSTAAIPLDTNHAQLAAITLLKKRIRLYLIWFGQKSSNENETQEITGGILGEVAIRSGGEILDVTGESNNFDINMINIVSQNSLQQQQQQQQPFEASNRQESDAIPALVEMRSPPAVSTQSTDSLEPSSDFNYFDNMIESYNLVSDDERKQNLRFPDDDDDDDEKIETAEMNATLREFERLNLQTGNIQIDLGIQSQLLLRPGSTGQIYFEVTNLRQEVSFQNFQISGEQRFLRSLSPLSQWLAGGQTATVIATLYVPPTAQPGLRDKITFTAQGAEQQTKSQGAELRILEVSEQLDTSPPALSWKFGSRCDRSYDYSSCSDMLWNLEVSAQDWDSGILRVQSSPKGIMPKNPYIAGTNNAVKLLYIADCCQPRVTLSVYDLAGNQRTATIDVRDIVLTEASIAAIVLGVILLILLIVLVVILIVWCCKRRKVSRELPTYRSHSERSR